MSRVIVLSDAVEARSRLEAAILRGHHVVQTLSPVDFHVDAARDWDPDVILMAMPYNGAAFPLRLGMLRDPQLSHVPFVVMGESEDQARALAAHAFIRTGASPEGVLELIAQLASHRPVT